jgi:putative aldouronate transport system substrate-binding protein
MKKLFSTLKKTTAIALSLASVMTIAACSNSGGDPSEPSKETTKESQTAENSGSNAEVKEFSYPMEKGDALTYWLATTNTVTANFANLGDSPFAKGLMKNTGVDIEFLQPPQGQENEQFSLIIADEDLPDIIEYNWVSQYSGGPEKAIKDGVIIPLNDVIDQYCPNLKKYLEENPDIDRMIKTDEGKYYAFPFIRGDEGLLNTIGLMLRGDWLKELNMEVPETIEEWETVLTAFKEKKGASAPFTFEYTNGQYLSANPIAYAFDTSYSFYLGSDEKVHFGAIEEGYKNYLQLMHDWYQKGLLDVDIATMKNDQVAAKVTNGDAGASMGQAGSRMGTWISAARKTNPDFSLVAAPQPTTKKGTKAEFGHVEVPYSGRASAAITSSCKDVERAARLLDYAFSEEGHMYYNFGTEGETYTMVDGNPVYTDLILNNPDGWPISQAMSAYIRGNYNGPFVQDVRYLSQYYQMEEQKETPKVWGSASSNGAAHVMPPITPTSDESKEFSRIMNQVNTYRDEMTLKFIFGDESLDKFDDYVKNIESMDIAKALEIQNAALERYLNR